MELKTLDINTLNLTSFADAGRLKEFAAFLHVKSLYSNSCVLNYTQKSLAAKSNLTVSQVRKYVSSWLSSGWCRLHKGNLVFNKLKIFDHTKKKLIHKLKIRDSVKKIHDDLLHLILKVKQAQFDRFKKLRSDLNYPHPLVQRRARRLLDKLNLQERNLPGEGQLFKISIKSIAKLTSMSVGSASGFIRRLKKKKGVKVVKGIKCIEWAKDKTSIRLALEKYPNAYFYNGCVVLHDCNSYQF